MYVFVIYLYVCVLGLERGGGAETTFLQVVQEAYEGFGVVTRGRNLTPTTKKVLTGHPGASAQEFRAGAEATRRRALEEAQGLGFLGLGFRV